MKKLSKTMNRRIRLFLFALLVGYLFYWFLSPMVMRSGHRPPPRHPHRITVPS